jgi:hypothetical protein
LLNAEKSHSIDSHWFDDCIRVFVFGVCGGCVR